LLDLITTIGVLYHIIKKIKNNSDYKRHTTVLPFINEHLKNQVKKIIRHNKIECNIAFKNTKLYSLTNSMKMNRQEPDIMNTIGVVYQLNCIPCKNLGIEICYIGEICRTVKHRLKEHLYKNTNSELWSEVYKHSINSHGNNDINSWEAKILDIERDEFTRLAREALRINENKSCINKSKGYYILGNY
jgi:hypothetical protein